MRLFFILLSLLCIVSACDSPHRSYVASSYHDSGRLNLRPVSFKDLKGWDQENFEGLQKALLQSCRVQSQPYCKALGKRDQDLKGFFETYFTPHQVIDSREGLYTGYYLPSVKGCLQKTDACRIPLYPMPSFKPIPTRGEIDRGALEGRLRPLLWLYDPVDAYFLHIQGSGFVELEDGRSLTVRFAGKNTFAYRSIGKRLIELNEMDPSHMSMESLKEWFYKHPDRQKEIFAYNPSYIFFALSDQKEAKGSAGVFLTPERSLAVDPHYIPYHHLIWLEVEGSSTVDAFQKLMISQDTGSAIKGALRGDLFFGAGAQSAYRAGHLKNKGSAYLFLPKKG